MDTRKATALAAATILTLGAGSISAAVDLGLFRTAGAAAAGKAATLTKGPGSPEVVQVYKDVVDPPGAPGAVVRSGTVARPASPGQSRTAAGSSAAKSTTASSTAHPGSADPELSTTTTSENGPQCAEPPDEKDPETGSTTSTSRPGDDHPEHDDSEEKDKATSTTMATPTSVATPSMATPSMATTVTTTPETCDDSNAPEPEDQPTTTSSIKPTSTTAGHREDR